MAMSVELSLRSGEYTDMFPYQQRWLNLEDLVLFPNIKFHVNTYYF